jgi:hypothetical protein
VTSTLPAVTTKKICFTCSSLATHRMDRENTTPVFACDNCTRSWREDAEGCGFAIEEIATANAKPSPEQDKGFDFEPRIAADMPIWARLLLIRHGIPFAAVSSFRIAPGEALAEITANGCTSYLHRRWSA